MTTGGTADRRTGDSGGNCVRALGIPGFTDAGVSSAPLERPKGRGNWGPQIACDISAHMSRREMCVGPFECSISIMLPWPCQRVGQGRALVWARTMVQVRTELQRYMIQLTQAQTATAQDLPGAARSNYQDHTATRHHGTVVSTCTGKYFGKYSIYVTLPAVMRSSMAFMNTCVAPIPLVPGMNRSQDTLLGSVVYSIV